MAQMFNPPHPGETLREDILPELGLTVAAAARQLGVSRGRLARDRPMSGYGCRWPTTFGRPAKTASHPGLSRHA